MAATVRRQAPPAPPLLTSVAFVCRQWPRIEALDHVTREIDALLDESRRWTLAEACSAGLEHLVERIAARDARAMRHLGHLQRQALATTTMAAAAAGGHIAVLRRLAELFPIAEGHLEILEWLFLHYPEPIQPGRLLRIAKRHDLYCVDWLVRTGKAVDYEMW
ncbi:Secreted RxLR effector protein 124 [Phytophthora ramorum]|uniref:Secreted RxLR effector protein 124 n=1 Tax=Phytophthora ramorum TaxID=164328 RepID=UPI0030A9CD0D|nr:Secreted RxLR effector protein 124 [Phytophthora ramorum]